MSKLKLGKPLGYYAVQAIPVPETMAAATAGPKTDALAEKIAAGILTPLGERFTALEKLMAHLGVTLATVSSRLEAMENAALNGSANGTTAKRAVRTAAAGAAKKEETAEKKGGAKDFANSMLYFKEMVAVDLAFREQYITPEIKQAAIDSGKLAKVKEEDGHKYFTTLAAAAWTLLSDEQKAQVKSSLATYKESLKRSAAAALEEEE